MVGSISRGQLLSRSARRGAVLLVGGSALGRFAGTATADPVPTADLAYARLLVGFELLATTFYAQAIAAANTSRAITGYLKRAFTTAFGGRTFNLSFPPGLTIEQASNALDAFTA